jgi:hypothetical protein
MALNTKITPGLPPLIWSSVQDAFAQVNLNFQEISATIGGDLVDFTALQSSMTPATTNTYTLGTSVDSWKRLHVTEYSTVPGSELNGLWAGTAQIKGISGTIDLPLNSTVNGNLIIDPIKTTFKTINVEGVGEIVANSFTDTLNLIPGDGITIGVTSNSDSIEFINTGVIDLTGTTYLGVTEPTPGRFTLTNTGVTNLTNTTSLPSGRVTGSGIHVDSSTGSIKITNTGILSVESSSPVSLSVTTDLATGVVSINNLAPDRDAFAFVQVSGQTTISAGGITSVLTVAEGYGIKLTTSDPRTLTISLDQTAGAIDLRASIFADDSTLLVNAVDGNIPAENLIGTFTGTVIGNVTGNLTGNADTATASTTVSLVSTNSTAAVHYVTFVNGATGDEEVRTDTALTYNPNTDTLTAGIFAGTLQGNVTGNVTGNADTASASTRVILVATNTAAATHFLTFVDAATGNEEVRTDTDLTYNPSTNTLSVVNISGTTVTANLTGNTTGYHTGDVKGSVVGDDSTMLVDSVDSKVVGRVETTTVRASTFLKTAVYNSNLQRNLAIPTPEVGMIIFNTATGKFEGNTDGTVSGWVALN